MNVVVLVGRLTKDVDFRYTADKKPIAHMRIAVDRADAQKSADFINITTFGKSAELCDRYLNKGRQIAVRGRIATGSYTKNGETVYTTEVIADKVDFLGSSKDSARSEDYSQNDYSEAGESFSRFRELEDDIPF